MVRHIDLLSICCILECANLVAGFSGWIDPDTIKKHLKIVSYTHGGVYDLVMSDEFERTGRKFKDGTDPMWTG